MLPLQNESKTNQQKHSKHSLEKNWPEPDACLVNLYKFTYNTKLYKTCIILPLCRLLTSLWEYFSDAPLSLHQYVFSRRRGRGKGNGGGRRGGGPVAMQHLPTVWWCLPRQAKLHVYSWTGWLPVDNRPKCQPPEHERAPLRPTTEDAKEKPLCNSFIYNFL